MKKTEKTYHENGNIQVESELNEKGELHGITRVYHENGQLKVEVNYTNNVQDDGEIISYHDNGTKARQAIRLNRDLNGEFSEWHENGLIKRKSTYEDGRICGDYKVWDRLGNLKQDFVKHKLIDTIDLDELAEKETKEVKVNWLQDIGPIYSADDYVPHVLLHNPRTDNDDEYIMLLCSNKEEAIVIIDHVIELNGGKEKFYKHEMEDWSHVFSGHLFYIRYRNELSGDYVIVELNRREEREYISLDDKSGLYGIHQDSKKVNSMIDGLNSIVYNFGEMTSGGGHLYYTASGSHIVSYWDDLDKVVEKFKSIVDCYTENAFSEELFGEGIEIKDFTFGNIEEIINPAFWSITFKTEKFKINLSQGNSSYQMNIYLT